MVGDVLLIKFVICSVCILCMFVHLGPVVLSIVSFTILLVVKMLIALISKISNSQVFLLKKKK